MCCAHKLFIMFMLFFTFFFTVPPDSLKHLISLFNIDLKLSSSFPSNNRSAVLNVAVML